MFEMHSIPSFTAMGQAEFLGDKDCSQQDDYGLLALEDWDLREHHSFPRRFDQEAIDLSRLQRIVIIGLCGSGKSTTSSRLVQLLGVQHIELDRINWLPNWQQRPVDEFRQKLNEQLGKDDTGRWVADGNYFTKDTVQELWAKADTIIWLDYTFSRTLFQLARRSLKRIATGEELFGCGNRESLSKHMQLNDDSLLYFFWNNYHNERRDIEQLVERHKTASQQFLHFQCPAETQEWLERVACVAPPKL